MSSSPPPPPPQAREGGSDGRLDLTRHTPPLSSSSPQSSPSSSQQLRKQQQQQQQHELQQQQQRQQQEQHPAVETWAPAITPATQPGPEDEFDIDDDPFGNGSDDDDGVTSVTSSVYACTYERGRRYHCFKNARYPIPNDDVEKDREDLKHAMLMELTDGVLFFAPVERPQYVIDCGTGTGIWAIEVADHFPSAHVVGIDATPIQPLWVPPNVEFLVDDCYQDWLSDDMADLVHFRFMAVVLRDIPLVLANAYKSLRPGGWIEFQELHGLPQCDDGTMPATDPFKKLYDVAREAYAKFGMSTTIAAELELLLRDAGFVHIHCKVLKVPIGVWARDETMRLIGLYQKTAVAEFVSTLAGRPFAALGLSEAEAQVTLALARKALEDTAVHRYFTYHFWWAQKPW